MRFQRKLKGRRIAVLAADGFEKVELTVPVNALRLSGATCHVISLRHGRIRGVNLHEPASRVHVHATIAETDPDDYDGLLIPGGFINPDLLRQSADAREFVRAFDEARKPIATLCHGPWVLASAGLLEGRTMTSWPGVRDDLVNAGAVWLDQELVRDGNLLTSRGPQDMQAFVPAILEFFAETEPGRTSPSARTTSDPQRVEPPALVVKTMQWTPRPSLRTALVAGAIAVGLMASNRRWRS
ncbi:MAG: type 1 glutamine amidotransferase [Acidobacteria bacterium]|nr:type 1 glutamine amidotransferase [Acidobacteriota bacterium]MBV9476032.1 type 1 glutamine amidotransferase [Acidobacteriota bacterium]